MKEFFNLGNKTIDTIHGRLFKYIDMLNDKCFLNRDEFNYIIKFIVGYFDELFEYEEETMKKVKYPYFEMHKKFHDDFKDKLQIIVQEFEQNPDEINTKQLELLIETLDIWLTEHIAKVDRYVRHYFE